MYDLFDSEHGLFTDGHGTLLDQFASIIGHDAYASSSSLGHQGVSGIRASQPLAAVHDEFEVFEPTAGSTPASLDQPAFPLNDAVFPLIARDDFVLGSPEAVRPEPAYAPAPSDNGPAVPLMAGDNFFLSAFNADQTGPMYGAVAAYGGDALTALDELVTTGRASVAVDDINQILNRSVRA